MSENNCPQFKSLLSTLRTKKGEFDDIPETIQKGLYTDILTIKQEIKETIEQIDSLLPIKAINPEGKEETINFKEEIKQWNSFYQRYDIKDTEGSPVSIPENLQLTQESKESIKEMIEKYGFNKIMIIPKGLSPNSLILKDNNKDNQEELKKEENTRDKQKRKELFSPLTIYPDTNIDENDPVWINKDIKSHNHINQPTENIQIILLKEKDTADTPQDHTEETHNKTYPDILEQESELSTPKTNIQGLDISQFLIYHRYYYDKHNKHLHMYQEDQATWLTKTAEEIKAGRSVDAYWDSGSRRLFLRLNSSGYQFSFLGSVFSCSLEHSEK